MRRLVIALTVLALAATACNGDDESDGATETGTAAETGTGPGEDEGGGAEGEPPPVEVSGDVNNHGTGELTGDRLDLELDDFYFEPTFVRATPGAAFTVRLHNEGEASHTFTIEAQDIDVVLEGGQEDEVQVALPTGPVEFICRFHAGQGMRGVFYFE